MILRRFQIVGSTTSGATVDRVRGDHPTPTGYPRKKRRPVRERGNCPRCGTLKALDQPGEMCSPCQRAPRCPVCEGHGATGRSRQEVCYRCGGSGIQPILPPEVKRRRAA
jgi:hypothetical protein